MWRGDVMGYKAFARYEECDALVIGETESIEGAETVVLKYMEELEEKQHNKDCYIWIEEGSCI